MYPRTMALKYILKSGMAIQFLPHGARKVSYTGIKNPPFPGSFKILPFPESKSDSVLEHLLASICLSLYVLFISGTCFFCLFFSQIQIEYFLLYLTCLFAFRQNVICPYEPYVT